MRFLFLFSLISMFAFAASAYDLTVTVKDKAGHPVANAVVLVAAPAGEETPAAFEWPNVMEQKNLQFSPYILVAPRGSKVTFPNYDRVRHHVYSFSKGNRFELKLYGREEERFIQFKNEGVVAVGCNIHDNMVGYIRIVETPFVALTDADGKAILTNLPMSTGDLIAWHPDLSSGKDVSAAFDTTATNISVTLGGAIAKSQRAHH